VLFSPSSRPVNRSETHSASHLRARFCSGGPLSYRMQPLTRLGGLDQRSEEGPRGCFRRCSADHPDRGYSATPRTQAGEFSPQRWAVITWPGSLNCTSPPMGEHRRDASIGGYAPPDWQHNRKPPTKSPTGSSPHDHGRAAQPPGYPCVLRFRSARNRESASDQTAVGLLKTASM
jgi:hypothetical protein